MVGKRGTEVGRGVVKVSVDGSGVNEEIVDAVEDAGPGVEQAGDEHGEKYGEHFSDGFRERMASRFPAITARLRERFGAAGTDAGNDAGDAAGESLGARLLERTRDLGDRVSEELGERLASRTESVRRGITAAFSDDFADGLATRFADRMSDTLGDRIELMLASAMDDAEGLIERLVSRNSSSSTQSGGDESSIGDRIAKMFGAGSRNNFLNLIGKSLGKVINLTETVSASLTKMTGVGGEGASMLSRIGVTGAAAGVSLAVVAAVLAVLVSVSGALLGIVTALASTIGSALVGAALVGGAALTALAAAGGLVAVAFTSMTDAQRGFLGDTFQPLKAELTGIGQLMITQMIPYFDTWSSNLQNSLLLIVPLAQRMGDVFGRAGNVLTSSFSGPGFQALFNALTMQLPAITMNLSRAFGGFLNGAAGTFAAVLPLVTRFSAYLEQVATRFSNFVNSAKGQNSITDFANRAVTSLQSLWNFLRELGGLITDVLFSPEAQEAGNSIFDGIADSLARVRKSISKGDLEKWFNDAIEFGSALWDVITGLKDTFVALYNSGVLEATAKGLTTFANVIDAANTVIGPLIDAIGFALPAAMAVAMTPLLAVASAVIAVGEAAEAVGGLFGIGDGGELDHVKDSLSDIADLYSNLGSSAGSSSGGDPFAYLSELAANAVAGVGEAASGVGGPSLSDLLNTGNTALNATSQDHGGYKPDPEKPKYKNPYIGFANSLIEQAPTVAEQMRKAMRASNKAVRDAINEATTAVGAGAVQDLFSSQIDSLKASGTSMVENARSALSSAAETLANASNKKDARRALKEVTAGQKALAAAIAAQDRLNAAAALLNGHQTVYAYNVEGLIRGEVRYFATLADYAEARARVADQLEVANQKLVEAIALRDNYASQVADSARTFGSILSTQAKSINGVAQALTADDITLNLRDRLDKLTKYQEQLRVLLGQGLSNEAYKQLVDAGVEQGGAYVEALVNGGQGSIAEVNELTAKINQVAGDLGKETSDRLYAAGVSAAQGLVDGLTSLSGQLDAAATALGNQIAASIKAALGIASPSKLMFDYMDRGVGDGLVDGLDAQHTKVGNAASRLSSKVAITPSLATAIAEGRIPRGVDTGVSGNQDDPRFRDLIINTPSEDPKAVAIETLNEVTGRL